MRLLVLSVFFCLGQALAAEQATGDKELGARLYLDFACYSCHGFNGTGRTPLSRETSGILSSERLFLSYLRLRADQNPINPKNSMPNYSADTLSDAEARDIYTYLVSLQDDPPEVDDIPAFVDILESAERRYDGDSDKK